MNPARPVAPPAGADAEFDTLAAAKLVFAKEIAALRAVEARLDERFTRAVDLLAAAQGRVVVTGVGKSGIVARKIAATFTSTGTRSFFLHPVEAAHGDMGILAPEDVLLAVSYSGDNEELLELLAACERWRIPIVALTRNDNSLLGRRSAIVIDCSVPEEACTLNTVPTASTTAALVVGDALALTLFQKRGLNLDHFSAMHPGGVLGRRLRLTVGDVMYHGTALPRVREATLLREALVVMTEGRLGCVFVDGADGRLAGIFTDGDLRRHLLKDHGSLGSAVGGLMSRTPRRTRPEVLAIQALQDMEDNPGGAITQLAVVNDEGWLIGAVHLHDIVRLGLASARLEPGAGAALARPEAAE